MEQRTLRLGDPVDDYCPRERRVTNHVIVAMVADGIRQTRCSTCEAEHEYKEARMPRKKTKQDDTPDLAGGVLVVHKAGNGQADDSPTPAPTPSHTNGSAALAAPVIADAQTAADESHAPAERDHDLPGGWIGHRPLIRATLPKTENDVPAPRAIPEFTMHQRPGRGFGGRGFRPHGFGGHNNGMGGGGQQGRDGNGPDGNRAPGAPGGRSRHRRRHRGKPR